jgi:hypothetical protein
MKKLVLASVMATASICLVTAPTLRAQGAGTVSIQNPAEFNAYQQASTQTDPAARAAAEESFLTNYPQSVVKNSVLDDLIDTYQKAGDLNKTAGAATRLLQVDPNNMHALYVAVSVKRSQCLSSGDAQVCDDAGAIGAKGLKATKPADTADADWQKMTSVTFPIFHSAIALDDLKSKKDYKGAIDEYKTELNLYPLPATQSSTGLVDTLELAEAYTQPGDTRDPVQAVWFYARFWNFAPAAYKAQAEPKLEYWYKRFHGSLDGLDAIKTASAQTLFKPDSVVIAPAPTPPEIVHNVITSTPDLTKLNLEDKEFILANGTPEDAQKLWSVVKDQQTPVPGVVTDATATVLKISVTTLAAVKPKDYVVKLTTPAACGSAPPAPSELHVKEAQDYIVANGVKADTDALDFLTESPAKLKKIEVEPGVMSIKVAVTQDAKDNKTPDFIVNLKEPVGCKEAPSAGFEYKLQPADELDATYDTYTAIPAAGARAATAQIVLRDGFIQTAKAAGPVHHVPAKPSAAHHAAH